jgi:hypothetical protein
MVRHVRIVVCAAPYPKQLEDAMSNGSDEPGNGSRTWDQVAVGRLILTIFDMPESADISRDYWNDAMQGSALLLAALSILAEELDDMHRDCLSSTRGHPALVEQIIQLVNSKKAIIRQKVVEALL